MWPPDPTQEKRLLLLGKACVNELIDSGRIGLSALRVVMDYERAGILRRAQSDKPETIRLAVLEDGLKAFNIEISAAVVPDELGKMHKAPVGKRLVNRTQVAPLVALHLEAVHVHLNSRLVLVPPSIDHRQIRPGPHP